MKRHWQKSAQRKSNKSHYRASENLRSYMKGSRLKEIDIDGGYPFTISECGQVIVNRWTCRVLTPSEDKAGYLRVWSGGAFGKRRSFLVHRLVALAWLECPENYADLEVNHKDGRKDNNDRTNLEWVTKSQNIQHSYDTGLNKNKTGPDKLKRNEDIRRLVGEGYQQKQVAEIYKMSPMQISRICRGITSGKSK